jgi:diacylglycerol O-acyltransferase
MVETTDAPLRWGEERELNALETLLWRIEADPRLRSPIVLVEVLDRAPEWDRFWAACEWATRMAPRLRQKLLEPALGLGHPTWITDPDFDLQYHVRRVALPAGESFQTFLRVAEQLAMTPLDRARAPWEAVLVEGLPEGRAALVIKIHHVATDGLGGVQLLSQLHSKTREATPGKPQPLPLPPERASSGELLRQQLGRDLAAVPGLLRQGGEMIHGLTDPFGAAREAASYAQSLGRMVSDPPAEPSPLLAKRSLSFRFLALDVSFPDFRKAARSVKASLNDAYLAALLGAYRRYHEAMGQSVDAIPMAMPISVRRPGDSAGGNRFVGVRFAGPVAIADPAERMQAVRREVRRIRAEPAVDALGVFAPALTRLPGALLPAVAGGLTKSNDLQASNVIGLRKPAYLAGARIDRVYGFGPLPGCAAMVTLLTHTDQCCIAANVDPAAVTDVGLFGECLLAGFEEVLSLHPGAVAPVLR